MKLADEEAKFAFRLSAILFDYAEKRERAANLAPGLKAVFEKISSFISRMDDLVKKFSEGRDIDIESLCEIETTWKDVAPYLQIKKVLLENGIQGAADTWFESIEELQKIMRRFDKKDPHPFDKDLATHPHTLIFRFHE